MQGASSTQQLKAHLFMWRQVSRYEQLPSDGSVQSNMMRRKCSRLQANGVPLALRVRDHPCDKATR